MTKCSYNNGEPDLDMVKLGITLAAIIGAGMLVLSMFGCAPQESRMVYSVNKVPDSSPPPADYVHPPWSQKGPLVYFNTTPETK